MVRKSLWNPAKAEANYRKHGIRFSEAERVFEDPHHVIVEDTPHSLEEDRFYVIGETLFHRTLFVSFTIRDDRPWLISARHATRAEKRRYMRGDRIRDREEVSDEDINFDDIPEMTDFSTGVRGRFYMRMSVHRVSVANDLIDVFPEDEDLNAALRVLIGEGRSPENIPPRPFTPEWIQRYNLDDDVANHFHSDESINAALRLLVDEGRVPKRKKKR